MRCLIFPYGKEKKRKFEISDFKRNNNTFLKVDRTSLKFKLSGNPSTIVMYLLAFRCCIRMSCKNRQRKEKMMLFWKKRNLSKWCIKRIRTFPFTVYSLSAVSENGSLKKNKFGSEVQWTRKMKAIKNWKKFNNQILKWETKNNVRFEKRRRIQVRLTFLFQVDNWATATWCCTFVVQTCSLMWNCGVEVERVWVCLSKQKKFETERVSGVWKNKDRTFYSKTMIFTFH